MILRFLAGSLIALGCGLVAEAAKAEQAFVCENGGLVMVKLADLERMKKENPCVARYFGLTVDAVPLPVQRPEPLAVARIPAPKVTSAPDRSAIVGQSAPQTATFGAPVSHEVADVAPPSASSEDFRHVRIINARPGATQWYLHSR